MWYNFGEVELMDRFVIIEIGSTNTKAYLYDKGEVKSLGFRTIEFKNHYKKDKRIDNQDKEELFKFVNEVKEENTYVFGTSIFRNLDEVQRDEWLKEFKDKVGIDFRIVTSDMENGYTGLSIEHINLSK